MTKPVTSQAITLPAPTGLNLVAGPGALSLGECLILRNWVFAKYGVQVRPGFTCHWTGATWASALPTSIFGFEGSTPARDRLFAVDSTYIYNASASLVDRQIQARASATTPTNGAQSVQEIVGAKDYLQAALTTDKQQLATSGTGYGIFCAFTLLSGAHYCYYADEVNGLYIYDEAHSGGTTGWVKPSSASTPGNFYGTDPSTFVFVTTWKKRVWFVKRDSTLAYYLPVNQYAGAVETFDFGPQFKHGGHLVGLWSWTLDAGEGVDDMLVAISSSGDVVIYQGTDPDYFPEIRLKGIWNVGKVPAGRKIATEHGGDLLILSSLGMIPLSKLVSGAPLSDPGLYATYKISPVFQEWMSLHGEENGWATVIDPQYGRLIILTPIAGTGGATSQMQWSMSLATGAWTDQMGIPMDCATTWRGRLYFGGRQNGAAVFVSGGTVDDWGGGGNTITADVLYGYQSGSPAVKRLLMARANFLNGSTPEHMLWGRTDFDVSIITDLTLTPPKGIQFWTADFAQPGWRGISGISKYVSVALSVDTEVETAIGGIDVLVDQGGIL